MDLKAKLDRAVEHEGKGEHDAAIALLDEIIAADPRFPQAHYLPAIDRRAHEGARAR